MKKILACWIGKADLEGYENRDQEEESRGPIYATIQSRDYAQIYFLYNYKKEEEPVDSYIKWVQQFTNANIEAEFKELTTPVHFGDIYKVADLLLAKISNSHPDEKLEILLSPGTPAMQAVWIILAKTKYKTNFIQSSTQRGVEVVNIPFDISADFVADRSEVLRKLTDLAGGKVAIDAAFEDIRTNNNEMNLLKAKATLLAEHEVPVLIYGETGTGKELFATAIHNASNRTGKITIVNCGAFTNDLINSELFGHVKGAFTGASKDKNGIFDEADGGTLFLDEFGELPAETQTRLLRVIQFGEFTPVGSTELKTVNVRIIAATNRDLTTEIEKGNFREDLFYRIAVGVLRLPPLRERPEDLTLLAETFFNEITAEHPSSVSKRLSAKAKNAIKKHSWRGNARELKATLYRAILWSTNKSISEKDIEEAVIEIPKDGGDILNKKLDENFNIFDVLDLVANHFIDKALNQTKTKEQARCLLKFHSTNVMDDYRDQFKRKKVHKTKRKTKSGTLSGRKSES